MCGLAGVLSLSPGIERSLLDAANASLHHRGPDDSGIWINGSGTCGLGHTRLSIIDLAGGHQPLSSPDGSIRAIVNGEFYGYEQTRRTFLDEGYRFQSHSDSEILIPLYLKYGARCVEHLRGEFAFLLWDEGEQTLLMARDRFGIKPLYYSRHQDRIYAASEVKALLAMGVPAHWDLATVLDEEFGPRDCESTLFRGVRALPPGHCLVARGAEVRTHRYWDFDYPRLGELARTATDADYVDEFWRRLQDAVALRLRADVPVGVYLSGGIDSSTVLSLMRQLSSSAVDAFTLSFDHEDFDEAAIARESAAQAGVRHTVIDIHPGELAPNFENTIWHNECPFTNNNTIAKYILSRHVRDAGLKVVLTGEGSDEILGGYHHFLGDMRRHNSNAIGARLARWHSRLLDALPGRTRSRLPDSLSAVQRRFGFVPQQLQFARGPVARFQELRGGILHEAARAHQPYASLLQSLDRAQLDGRDPLNQSLYLASKSSLPNRILSTLGDRVEMAHSIEARLPFLDHKVVEFLARVPVEMKIKVLLRGGIEKHILKEAARDHVTDTLYRRRKHPFTAPTTVSAVADPMSEVIADTLHGADLRNLGLYDQAAVLRMYELSRQRPNGLIGRVMQHIAGLAVMQRRFGLSVG